MPTKVFLVKVMVLSIVMYGCESWTMKNTELWRNDAFELWWWKLLRVPWTARRSNQSILKEISPEHWLERLILKLKLQYFGNLMQRVDTLEKTLMLEKLRAGGEGSTEDEMADDIIGTIDMSLSKLWEIENDREAWCAAVKWVVKTRQDLATE